MTMKIEKKKQIKMPPNHSEIKQELNLILDIRGINGWRQINEDEI